ncbi:MAG: peptide chain release factor N(5)-glutamine methyltransferase [Clostridiales bacterium]|nr:peptide chain release factor N(5)-glutamine methyltransferase [Clostridiales bacterium]
MRTLRETLKEGEQRLLKAGVPDGRTDAWALMEFAFGIEKSYYFLHENDKIDEEQGKRYEKLLKQREERIPLQQITGSAWFMGYEFYVNEQVLIPRFDTEILVEEAGKRLEHGMKLLDVCTGSGCILLSLLGEHCELGLTGAGVDISPEALLVAKENSRRLEIPAEFTESDLFSRVRGTYDMIVSNPPYIASKELETLMPEVRDHEPRLALDGKEDGLYFYRKIVEQADGYLNPGGWLCFEIGYDQGEALRALLTQAGYEQVEVCRDLAGLDRVALGRKRTG